MSAGPDQPQLSTLRAPAKAFVVLTVAVAIVIIIVGLWLYPMLPWQDIPGVACWGICAAAGVEFSRRVERARERYRPAGGTYRSFHGVWILSSVLLFPPGVACTLVAAYYAWVWLRVERFVLHRWVFSAAVSIIGTGLAGWAYRAAVGAAEGWEVLPRGWAAVSGLVAGGVVAATNTVLLAGVLFLAAEDAGWTWPTRTERAVSATALCMGMLTAGAYDLNPLLVWLAVPVLHLVQRSLLVTQLEAAARTDTKTGLANMAYWQSVAEREIARAARRSEPVAVLVTDLDHFKRVNDQYGHLVGDRVLLTVARRLEAAVRTYDIVGRFGGEEFVILLPATGAAEAEIIAERIRTRIAATEFENEHGTSFHVTASIGIAYTDCDTTSPCSTKGVLNALIQAADTAVYSAKTAGRNCIRTAPIPEYKKCPSAWRADQ